ncbi:MAG TPA: zinc ribbon domain-containing protein [Pirellulales bacterium]|nr:zinc ribbon domain-containing protein [Pirellulales bacterium]
MPTTIPQRQLSSNRKRLYYAGLTLAAIGALLFLSTFVTAIANFGDFANFDADVRSTGYRAVGGMVLIFVGVVLAGVAVRGLAGSGILLDPEKARQDIEPWSRMAGGVVRDALAETGLVREEKEHPVSEPPVKVRCQKCSALNDEDAKFCKQCGVAI